ncbi:MAG: type II toxin-antitoxin system RelE/ParE family toxin [Pacificimonas sp.]
MIYDVVLTELAIEDLKVEADWIAANADRDTARAFIDSLYEKCQSLSEFPFRGRPRESFAFEARSISFRDRVIFYTVEGNLVSIQRVIHSRRILE